jgi:hypothetical protein
MIENNAVTQSSGNSCADLGFINWPAELLKARLVGEGDAAVKRRELANAADLIGVKAARRPRSGRAGGAHKPADGASAKAAA